MVVRFVRTVLEFGQDRRAEATALVGQIDPAMGRDLELALLRVRPLNGAHVPVVSGVFVRRAEWKSHFEVGGQGSPIDRVGKLDPVARIARGKANRLYILGVFRLARYFQRYANRTTLSRHESAPDR